MRMFAVIGLCLLWLISPAQPRGSGPKSYRSVWVTLKVTAYCPCEKCCGVWSKYAVTKTGKTAWSSGVAVDPRAYPLGTYFDIPAVDGYPAVTWVPADDTGSRVVDQHIDRRFAARGVDNHAMAVRHGVKYLRVRAHVPVK